MSEAGDSPKDPQLAVQLAVLEALAKGQQRQLDAAAAPWKARRDARRARRCYNRSPDDEVVEKRLIQRITSRAFSVAETMDVVMLWLGPGGVTPADEKSDAEGNNSRDKRRHKWMWVRATEHDPLSLVEDYNWRMLEGHPFDEDEWGEYVEGLDYPILPFPMADRDKDVAAYNAELLAYAKARKRGLPVGGATNVGPAAFFRQDTASRPAKPDVKGAEPLLPLVMGENGSWSADAAALGSHVRAEIAAALAAHSAAQAPPVVRSRTCFKCGKPGHFSRECRAKKPRGAGEGLGEEPSKPSKANF